MKGIYILLILSGLLFLLFSMNDLINLTLPDWIIFYGNDFLCMPVVLSICLIAARIAVEQQIYLPVVCILSLIIFYSLFFEVILPQTGEDYTADFVDVLMYFAGGFLFYIIQKRQIGTKKNL